jgi:hypothetical protein
MLRVWCCFPAISVDQTVLLLYCIELAVQHSVMHMHMTPCGTNSVALVPLMCRHFWLLPSGSCVVCHCGLCAAVCFVCVSVG